MKNTRWLALVCCLLLASGLAQAEASARWVQKLKGELNLTDQQVEQLQKIMDETREQRRALKKQARALHQTVSERVKSVLNEEQRKQFEAMHPRHRKIGYAKKSVDENDVSANDVPKPVLDAFARDFPKTQGVEYERKNRDGKTLYEIEYRLEGKERELLYGADGTLVEKSEGLQLTELPAPVLDAVTKGYPGARVKEAEKVMKPDGALLHYEVEIRDSGQEREIELDATGKVLRATNE